MEAKKDAQISCSSSALSTCKTERKYEYLFGKLFVIQMSFPTKKYWFKIIDSKFFGLIHSIIKQSKMPQLALDRFSA